MRGRVKCPKMSMIKKNLLGLNLFWKMISNRILRIQKMKKVISMSWPAVEMKNLINMLQNLHSSIHWFHQILWTEKKASNKSNKSNKVTLNHLIMGNLLKTTIVLIRARFRIKKIPSLLLLICNQSFLNLKIKLLRNRINYLNTKERLKGNPRKKVICLIKFKNLLDK